MALDGLERTLRKKYPHSGSRALKGKNKQVNLIRYADDFIITGLSKEVLEAEVKPLVTAFLQGRGLELSEEKTRITHIEDGFDFLRQNVRKYKRYFLTRPSKKNVKAFLTSIRKVIQDNKQATAYWLITQLDPTIRGWANFHRHAAAKETFVHVDTAIFKALWRWARRRHPKKGKRWVADRYFGRSGNRNWHFFGTAKDRDGNTSRNWLCHASATPVTRYKKLKEHATPTTLHGNSIWKNALA
jgi:RNA-directed DNA polymerase